MSGTLRHPRGFLVVSGARVEVLSLEVHLSREAKSDSFHAQLAMSGLPDGADTAFWCDTPEIDVSVLIGTDGADTTIFAGQISDVRPNWFRRTIDITGHDKSKPMTERRSLSEAFKNKKGREIVEEVAKRHGLKVELSGETAKAGRLYDIDTVHHPRDLTDWDLVNYLADAEGLTVAVDGDTLHLGPEGEDDVPTIDITYEAPTPSSIARGTFMALSGVHNKALTKKTTVKVRSHDHRTGKQVTGTKTLAAATGAGKDGDGILYEFNAPGLKQDRASRVAEKRLRRRAKQERQISFEIPGEPRLRARMRANLTGTGTSFDQPYDIESVEHRLNEEEGYRCVGTAKAATQGREMSDG